MSNKEVYYHFEDVLRHVGSLGRYQWMLFSIIQYSTILQAFSNNVLAFTKIIPTWTCYQNNNETNETKTEPLACPDTSHCYRNNDTNDFISMVTEWNLYCDRSFVPTTIIAVQTLGLIPGSILFNHLIDNYGRKWSSYLLTVGILLLSLLSSFAWNWHVFAVIRFLLGCLFGGYFLVTVTMQVEIVQEKDRMWLYGLDGWSLGNALLALVAYMTGEWRRLIIASQCLCLPLIGLWLLLDESPRWLLQKGKLDQALKVLNKMARFNKKPNVEAHQLSYLAEQHNPIELITKHDDLQSGSIKKRRVFSFCDIFSTKKSTVYFLTLSFAWFACSGLNYGLLNDVTDLSGSPYLNFFLVSLLRLAFQLALSFADRQWSLPRRLEYLGPLAIVVLLMSAITVTTFIRADGGHNSLFVTISHILSTGVIGVLWLVICIIPVELFPTVIRNIAVGGCSISGRIGGMVGPLLLNLKNFWLPIPFLIFSIIGWINLISAYFLIPETANKPLFDSIEEVVAEEDKHQIPNDDPISA